VITGALCACGIHLEVGPDSADAGMDASTAQADARPDPGGPDGSPVSRTCDASWALSEAEAIKGIAPGQSAGQARLSSDETELFFSRFADNRWHLFRATRTDTGAAFEHVAVVAELEDATFSTYWPSISADGLTLSFSRLGLADGGQQTLQAQRADAASAFGPPVLFQDASALLFQVPGGDEYFLSTYPGTGFLSIFDGTGSGGAFVFQNQATVDFPYWYEPRASTLWFTRDSIPMSVARTDGVWAQPLLATTQILVTWVSPDGCRLYGAVPSENEGTLKVQRRLPPQ
jgi:hypothetical protein